MIRFTKGGLLAMQPQALLELYVEEPPKREVKYAGGYPVVEIIGPVVHHAGTCFDSYDAIHDRVVQACESSADTVILKIDSPGGEVSGCFDTVSELKALCKAAGKKLVAFVDGAACSAAYAFAVAADEIVVTPASVVGSIGVIDARVDLTAQDAAMGVRFAFITSGARKADGNPHQPITEEEVLAKQATVDAMASVFFGVVTGMRPSLSLDSVVGLQARTVIGAAAVAAGLADRVQSFDELLATLAAGATIGAIMSDYEKALAALKQAASGESAEAKRAQRALAALSAESDDGPPKDEDEDEGEEAVAAESEDGPPKPKDKDEEAASAAVAAAGPAAALAALVNSQGQRLAELEAATETQARAALLDSRPDLTKDLRGALAAMPLADVKKILAGLPKAKAPKLAAAAVVQPTRGDAQGDGAQARLAPEAKAALDAQMGLSAVMSTGVENTQYTLTLGKPMPVRGKAG